MNMKKVLIICLCMMLTLVLAGTVNATISGSKHDLTNAGGQTTRATSGNLSSCQFCHTPHKSPSAIQPLWNRSTPSASYTLYDSGGGGAGSEITLSGTSVTQPGNNSKTCLSCHDGTISIGDVLIGTDETTFTGNVDGTGKLTNASSTYFGTDLSSEHPVGVVYNSATSGPGLNNVVNANNEIGGKKWKIYGGGDGVGKVECGSCHDPHNTTVGETPFLKDTSNTICSDCHSAK